MIKGFSMARATLLAATAAAGMYAPAVLAAEQADGAGGEIVVTAQRREERQVDVPITVTSLSQEQLTTANVKTLSDISRVTPALRFDSVAAFVQPSVRGIGTGVASSGVGSNVGIYVDGFYSQNSLAADFDLLNVRSVQVLKGPQGTLFGRNTTGGAILVQSIDPSEDTSGQVKALYGRFNEVSVQAYGTTGLAPGIAFDLEGAYRRGDGFLTDLTGNDKIGRHESWSVRAGVKAEITPDVSVLLRYTHNDLDDPNPMLAVSFIDPIIGLSTANFAPAGTYTTSPDRFAGDVPNFVRTITNTYQGTAKADLGFANLTSYTQYRTENTNMSEDLDHIGLTIFQGGFTVRNRTFSQEFLLTSKSGPALQWTAGAFYFSNKDVWRFLLDNTPATGRLLVTGSSTTTRSAAAFVDLTYEVSPKLFVTAGARYSHDQIDDAYYMAPSFSAIIVPVTKAQADAVKSDRVTPRVVVRYKPTEQSSIYASYTRGYKAGMLDVGGSTGNPVEGEDIDAFEVGFKYDERAFSFEAAAFYYDYRNLQVSSYLGNPPSAVILNAANSEIYGVEGQVRYRLNDNFDLNAGATWTHARYKEFEAPIYVKCPDPAGCGAGTSYFVQLTNLRNVPMTHTPEFTGNVGARYRTEMAGGEFALSGNLYYTSSFYFGPSGTQFPQEAYEVLAMRAQWTDSSERFTVAVYGDNLTDNRHKTQVQYNFYGAGATYSAPVTYGVELGVRF